jgi:hypothetical protein
MRKERNFKDVESFFWKVCKGGFFYDFILFQVYRFCRFEKQKPPPETLPQCESEKRTPAIIHPSHNELFYFHYSDFKLNGSFVKFYLNAKEVQTFESRFLCVPFPLESIFLKPKTAQNLCGFFI